MKKLLISGFTTFSDHKENSSQIMAQMFAQTSLPGLTIHTTILPVAFSNAFETLKIEIDSFKPDYVICLGLAGNRRQIDLEKVAINLIHCSIPDNDGVLAQDLPIVSDGPAAYFSTLPIKLMQEQSTPFQVEVSFSAGAYVCNYLMYQTLHYLKDSEVKAGFIHLPHLEENKTEIFASLSEMFQIL